MFWGLVWFTVAAFVTLATYASAGDPGSDGSYVFWWGPMAFGAWKTLRGFWDLRAVNQGLVPKRYLR